MAEMTKPAPRGVRNKNPLNLRDFGIAWDGLAGHDADRYAIFKDPVYGVRAAAMDLLHDWQKGKRTVQALIDEFAPAADNNKPKVYAATVAKALRVAPGSEIDLMDRAVLVGMVKAMSHVELGGVFYPDAVFEQGADMALAKRRVKSTAEKVKEGAAAAGGAGALVEPVRQGIEWLTPAMSLTPWAQYALIGLVVVAVGLGLYLAIRGRQ